MDSMMLERAIKRSGLKQMKIAASIGMPTSSFYNKTSGRTAFTVSESLALKKVLKMDWDEYETIFFDSAVLKIEQEDSE